MNSKLISRTTLITIAMLALAACKVVKPDSADVNCKGADDRGMDCEVKRTAGNKAIEACWDMVVSCRNGEEMKGSACHQLAAEESAGVRNMPLADFAGRDRCDAGIAARIENMKVTRR
ncbi:hypothetical protein [Luteimonas sp. e5]